MLPVLALRPGPRLAHLSHGPGSWQSVGRDGAQIEAALRGGHDAVRQQPLPRPLVDGRLRVAVVVVSQRRSVRPRCSRAFLYLTIYLSIYL